MRVKPPFLRSPSGVLTDIITSKNQMIIREKFKFIAQNTEKPAYNGVLQVQLPSRAVSPGQMAELLQ